MKAWHFLSENERLRYDDARLVQPGKTYRLKSGNPCLCKNGMHGSKRILDALQYAPGPIVCRVDITGDVIKTDDKIVGRVRKVLWMVDATNILHEFACRCAEDALKLVKNPDPRSIAAIEAKRKWLRGEISNADLGAAREAAWAAVRDAAGDAAGDAVQAAAWDAAEEAAEDAAGQAAEDAAWAAAGDAVQAAAWDAAGDAVQAAAWDAAWATARATARESQNRRLTAMVIAARRKET